MTASARVTFQNNAEEKWFYGNFGSRDIFVRWEMAQKKSREEKIIFFLSEKTKQKKSFVSGRSYELFCTKKRKVFNDEKNEGDEKKRMRNMKIFLCINLHFIFLSPNDDLFTISSHLPHSSALLPLSGFFFWHYNNIQALWRGASEWVE